MEDTGYRLSIRETNITPEMHLFAPEEQYVYSNSMPLKSPIKLTLVISGNPTVNGNG